MRPSPTFPGYCWWTFLAPCPPELLTLLAKVSLLLTQGHTCPLSCHCAGDMVARHRGLGWWHTSAVQQMGVNGVE